jgi:hypothetical protein
MRCIVTLGIRVAGRCLYARARYVDVEPQPRDGEAVGEAAAPAAVQLLFPGCDTPPDATRFGETVGRNRRTE